METRESIVSQAAAACAPAIVTKPMKLAVVIFLVWYISQSLAKPLQRHKIDVSQVVRQHSGLGTQNPTMRLSSALASQGSPQGDADQHI